MGCWCSKATGSDGFVASDAEPEGMLFSMWVVSVDNLLKMKGPPLYHQELIEQGVLVKWHPGMKVTFVSHQWIDGPHPDPEGRQLAALITLINNLRAHTVSIVSDIEIFTTTGRTESLSAQGFKALTEGYVWLDFFSIPQCIGKDKDNQITRQQQIDAIMSIPVYVEQCEVFLVLCPPLLHQMSGEICDLATWRQRGWCRAELTARFLSTKRRPTVLVMRSATKAMFISISMATMTRVGLGKFSVLGDKGPLRRLLEHAHERKMKTYNLQDRSSWEGLFMANLGATLTMGLTEEEEGLPSKLAEPSLQEQDEFLSSLGFKSWRDVPKHRYGPLHSACFGNKVGMVRAALAAGASDQVNLAVDQFLPNLNMPQHIVPLHTVCLQGSPEIVEELLNARADVSIRCSTGFGPLEMCGSRPPEDTRQLEIAKLLLRAGASLEPGGAFHSTALNSTMYSASYDMARLLLEHKADPNAPDIFGAGALHWVAMYSGKTEMAQLVLKYKAEVDAQAQPRGAARALLFAARAASVVMTFGEVGHFFQDVSWSTPLHQAARNGFFSLSKMLLEARADPSRRNADGKTPADLARYYEHSDLLKYLEEVQESSGQTGFHVAV